MAAVTAAAVVVVTTKYRHIKKFPAFSLSDAANIMLINVKIPASITGI